MATISSPPTLSSSCLFIPQECDPTASPAPTAPVRKILIPFNSKKPISPPTHLTEQTSPLLCTPKSPAPPSSPSPKPTPDQRICCIVNQKNQWALLNSIRLFTDGTKNGIYSIKISRFKKDGTFDKEWRYIGATARGTKRLLEHVSFVNHPKGTSKYARKCKKIHTETKDFNYKISVGLLAQPQNSKDLNRLEKKAIIQHKIAGKKLLNQRAGGGGGTVREKSTMSNKIAKTHLLPLLKNFIAAPLRLNEKTKKITHSFSRNDLTTKKVIYIFERIHYGRPKRYVGITDGAFGKRLASHLSQANHYKSCPLKDNTFYKDISTYWKQFKVKYIPVGALVDKGATTAQLEKIAINILHAKKRDNEEGGYNQNNGGGGGAVKK